MGIENKSHGNSGEISANQKDIYMFDSFHPRFTYAGIDTFRGRLTTHAPALTDALIAAHANYKTGREFVARLGRSFVGPNSLDKLFAESVRALNTIAAEGVTFDRLTMRILAASAVHNTDAFVHKPDYVDKITTVCIAHAKAKKETPQLPEPKEKTAVDLTEPEAALLGGKILQTIFSTKRELGISSRTGIVEIKGEGRGKSQVHTEFFNWVGGTEYVRVGHLFFVDALYKNKLPSDIVAFAESNIIFVKSMHRTELSNRLGYYTANTIASIMQADIQGNVVLDCGTGSGILSLAALRLGARGVVSVDLDRERNNQARKNFDENCYSNDPNAVLLSADLMRDRSKIFGAFGSFEEAGNITILSNIGSWDNYPITNLTGFTYIEGLGELPGWWISNVISGGYSHTTKKYVDNEERYLRSRNIFRDLLPSEDIGFDAAFLDYVGFKNVASVCSEALDEPGQFTHTAKSMIFARK